MTPSPTFMLLAVSAIFVCFPLPSSGEFTMKFSLFCPGGYHWCANVFVYNHDPKGTHDFVAEKNICSPENNPKANVTVDFGTIRLHGDSARSYGIMPLITHNCSSTGLQYCAAPPHAIDIPVFIKHDINLAIAFKPEGDKKRACVHPKMAT